MLLVPGVTLLAGLAAGPAAAQDLPPAIEKTLWCGHALGLAAVEIGRSNAEEGRAIASLAELLVTGARQQLLAASYPEAQVAAIDQVMAEVVKSQLAAPETAKYTVEDCRALIAPPAP